MKLYAAFIFCSRAALTEENVALYADELPAGQLNGDNVWVIDLDELDPAYDLPLVLGDLARFAQNHEFDFSFDNLGESA